MGGSVAAPPSEGGGYARAGLDGSRSAPYQTCLLGENVLSSALSNRRGIVAMLTAMTLFTGNDTLTKMATAELPTGQIMAIRGIFAVLLTLGLVIGMGEARHLRELKSPILAGRAALEAAVAFAFLTALGQLQLANITAILQATPIIITLLTVILGLEQVGWRRWTAIAVGFLGVLLIVKPSLSGFNVYAGLALASAALVACRDLATRSIPAHVPTVVVTFSTTLIVTALGFALSLRETWAALSATEYAMLAGAAVFVTLGNLAIIKAFRIGEMSVVSPFRYSVVLTSLITGFLVFGELPDLISVAGIALIVLSGLYTIHREQVRLRQAVQNAPAALKAGGQP
jgi:drug/metabolite transporter (DMT)-like permease